MIDRRKFALALGLATLSPIVSFAQQSSPATTRIGFIPLGSSANAYDRSLVDAFRDGLNKVGLIENRQVIVDVVATVGKDLQRVRNLVIDFDAIAIRISKIDAALIFVIRGVVDDDAVLE